MPNNKSDCTAWGRQLCRPSIFASIIDKSRFRLISHFFNLSVLFPGKPHTTRPQSAEKARRETNIVDGSLGWELESAQNALMLHQ